MRATNTVKIVRNNAKPTPAVELAMTITINSLYRDLKALRRPDVGSPFDTGLERDADAAWAMDLVEHEVTDMLSKEIDPQGFEHFLYRLSGVIRCAQGSLTEQDTFYFRQLGRLVMSIDVFGEMVDEAGRLGPKFLQREAQ